MYKKSEKKLSKMKGLKNEGRASQKAVDLAITQVALAVAGVGMATVNVVRAAQNAAIAAETSLGTGMYAAGYVDTTHHTDFLKTNTEQSAHRGGSFAQDLWESNSIVNNYQNLNQITANQYNQIYNSSNNQDIAIGNEVSYVQHVYDNENVNNYAINVAGAFVGGFAGAGGAAWGAYVGGADVKGILMAAGTGGVIGTVSGFMMNQTGVIAGIRSGAAVGSGTGFVSSIFNTYMINPDVTGVELLNNGIEGAIGGAVVGATNAAFTPIGGGIPGAIVGAQTGLAVDLFMGAINAKYDILNTSRPSDNKTN